MIYPIDTDQSKAFKATFEGIFSPGTRNGVKVIDLLQRLDGKTELSSLQIRLRSELEEKLRTADELVEFFKTQYEHQLASGGLPRNGFAGILHERDFERFTEAETALLKSDLSLERANYFFEVGTVELPDTNQELSANNAFIRMRHLLKHSKPSGKLFNQAWFADLSDIQAAGLPLRLNGVLVDTFEVDEANGEVTGYAKGICGGIDARFEGYCSDHYHSMCYFESINGTVLCWQYDEQVFTIEVEPEIYRMKAIHEVMESKPAVTAKALNIKPGVVTIKEKDGGSYLKMLLKHINESDSPIAKVGGEILVRFYAGHIDLYSQNKRVHSLDVLEPHLMLLDKGHETAKLDIADALNFGFHEMDDDGFELFQSDRVCPDYTNTRVIYR
ncbi:hypothetical protein [Vibrio mediterranei]|uniref:hypothetical protein n=1 Tax=Vibrio mediterranei TaxID=689 RepID=UPI004067DC24